MPAPYTLRQQLIAVTDVLESAYHSGGSLQRCAHDASASGGFELTNDLWESAHRLLWARIQAGRSFREA
jgi:hypothetical protein